MKNWKTTLAGVLIFLLAGASAVWPDKAPLFATLGSIASGLGLTLAKDANHE